MVQEVQSGDHRTLGGDGTTKAGGCICPARSFPDRSGPASCSVGSRQWWRDALQGGGHTRFIQGEINKLQNERF